MAIVCPTVLAQNAEEYRHQMDRVASFASRVQIDLSDGHFAPVELIPPRSVWWPSGIKADIHLMFRHPIEAFNTLVTHKPHMIICHAEADGDFSMFAAACRSHHVKVGVALLPHTPPENIVPALELIDHVLIFSGDLGHMGGHADTGLLEKVGYLKRIKPSLEIGWDGGITDQNVSLLVSQGVDVLNTGSFIQNSPHAFRTFTMLQRIADETGTT